MDILLVGDLISRIAQPGDQRYVQLVTCIAAYGLEDQEKTLLTSAQIPWIEVMDVADMEVGKNRHRTGILHIWIRSVLFTQRWLQISLDD